MTSSATLERVESGSHVVDPASYKMHLDSLRCYWCQMSVWVLLVEMHASQHYCKQDATATPYKQAKIRTIVQKSDWSESWVAQSFMHATGLQQTGGPIQGC